MALEWTLRLAGSLRGRAGEMGKGYGNGQRLSMGSAAAWFLCRMQLKPSQRLKSSVTRNQAGGKGEKNVF